MKPKPISDILAEKTFAELSKPPEPKTESRSWQSAQGYKFLFPWSNAVLLRILIRKITEDCLPNSEHRMKAQIDDASRSVVANIEEGFKRTTTSEYLEFLGYSQGSLEEVRGDIERIFQDGFLKSVPESNLGNLGIDLKKWGLWCRNPLNSSRVLYFPLESRGVYGSLKELRGKDLTYEIMKELATKTDWLLRGLVESLEKKLIADGKYYEIERLRIKDRLKWRR